MEKILAQGAEALITKKGSSIIKNRIKKSYRLPVLDEKLRKQRTKKEFKLLQKASPLIPVPKILKHYSDKDTSLELEYIEGKKLSQFLESLKNAESVCKKIGQNIAKLHDANIIHGDLTTSNMIFSKNKIYFIDFGLGFESNEAEHKAVDLHVLKEALNAKHFEKSEIYWKAILEGYKTSKNVLAVLQRLKTVEKRGRYKQNY